MTTGRSQVIRMLRLIVALRSDRCPNASELAELCGVSRRTICRDLDTIRAAGVPVLLLGNKLGYQIPRDADCPLFSPRP